MTVELTDQKRYELEKDNIISLLLETARHGVKITEEDLAKILRIDPETTEKLVAKLRSDGIVK